MAASIRVEGKATAKLEIGSVDTRSVSVPRSDDAVAASERRRIEEAIEKLKDDRGLLQATVLAAESAEEVDRQPDAAAGQARSGATVLPPSPTGASYSA